MAKKRTLNEYRQTKEYQGSKKGRKYLDNLETPSQSFIEDQEAAKQLAESKEANNPDTMESVKEMITNKIIKQFDNWIFEMVSVEMSKHCIFRETNYLTEAGMDEFEDTWFEFYHEHHGDILYQVKKNLFE